MCWASLLATGLSPATARALPSPTGLQINSPSLRTLVSANDSVPFPALAPAPPWRPFKMFDHMAAQSCAIRQSVQGRKGYSFKLLPADSFPLFPLPELSQIQVSTWLLYCLTLFIYSLKKKKRREKEKLCISSARALNWKNEGNSLLVLLIPPPLLLHHCGLLSMTKWAPQASLCKALIPPWAKGVLVLSAHRYRFTQLLFCFCL